MTSAMERGLKRNIWLYGYYKIFIMRAFLPLIAIYLTEVGGVTLGQIGFLVTLGAVTALVAEIPTGYFADRVSRKTAMLTGAVLVTLGSAALVVGATFAFGAAATFLTSFGYAFMAGAGPAMMHDSLERLGRTGEYVKVMGRAQSKGLIGNVVLVGLVPLTYAIDKRMPFILGLATCFLMLALGIFLTEPPRDSTPQAKGNPLALLIASLRMFVNRRTILFFVGLGLLGGIYSSAAHVNSLVFADLGIDPSLIGLMFAGASVLGAIGGFFIHHGLKLSFQKYVLLDAAVCAGFFLSVGLTRNMWVAIVAFVLNMGFWRLRSIMYQNHLLNRLGAPNSKATLLSTVSFFDKLSQIWQPLVIVAVVGGVGYYHGYAAIGLVVGVVFSSLLVVSLWIMGVKNADQPLPATVPKP